MRKHWRPRRERETGTGSWVARWRLNEILVEGTWGKTSDAGTQCYCAATGDCGGAWVWEAVQRALQRGEVDQVVLTMTTASAKRERTEVVLGTVMLAQHH